MRPLLFAALLSVAPAALSAQTLTTRDIVTLTQAGLGEEVLLALIDVHRPVFPVDPDTLRMLRDAGVRQNVIVAMVRSGRDTPRVEPVPDPEPHETPISRATPPAQVVVIEHPREEPRVREVVYPVAVPVYVPVRVHRPRLVEPLEPVRRLEPVYWGFGGKLRPDAWQPSDGSPHKPFWVVERPQKR